MSKKLNKPSKKELIEKYQKFGSTLSSLAGEYKVSHPTIRKWLKFYGAEIKSHQIASQQANLRPRLQIPDKELLKKLYEDTSLFDLANYFKVGQETINIWLEHHNIKKKIFSNACSIGREKEFKKKIDKFRNIESEYENSGYNLSEIKRKFHCSNQTLNKVFEHYNIEKQQPVASQAEFELFEFLGGDWELHDRKLIPPYEIDLINHKLKLAVEYCGLYWHSQFYGKKYYNYHKQKTDQVEKAGYQLITIFESDDMEKVKHLLNMKTNKASNIIGARQCSIKQIDNMTAHYFEKEHHLMGNCGCTISYGLFFNDSLVSCMTFGAPRFNKKYKWEMVRFTNKKNYIISGGANKLFSFFIKEKTPTSVITYADRRFGSGKVYQNLGFTHLENSLPNYWYFKKGELELHSRMEFQKHKLKNKLQQFNEELSEFENMLLNGYDRIWDCGNGVYVYQKS